ncbi:hypothetical protein MiYa_04744 [Microcystis aeruginosa NIES-2519]|uniref:Transposase IS4-like domain-containing protein n=1 Tax=Microcystis aeruginosa NIES-2519 TaxID=2303981 RepID=A0A5A5RE16_MICAE|nr:hypothetical protein MiYa_04744 [Microcystis aeruginosa NIES-2519]
MRWYSYRWLIERYHFVLKSGCGLEKLQLETGRRIEMALATYSIRPLAKVLSRSLYSNIFEDYQLLINN